MQLTKKQKVFDKSYLPQWTEEVFLVSQVIPGVGTRFYLKTTSKILLPLLFSTKNLSELFLA